MKKNKLVLFVVECEKKLSAGKGNSDTHYIKKLMNYLEYDKKIQFNFIPMHGKCNYNKYDISKQIKEKQKVFKSLDKSNIVEIVYVIDKDDFLINPEDNKFLINIEKFVDTNNYRLIFFTRNIEEVLHGKNITKNKTREAIAYKPNDINKLIEKLSFSTPNKKGSSNFKCVLDSIYKK